MLQLNAWIQIRSIFDIRMAIKYAIVKQLKSYGRQQAVMWVFQLFRSRFCARYKNPSKLVFTRACGVLFMGFVFSKVKPVSLLG